MEENIKREYYVEWSNFETDGPFDSVIECFMKSICTENNNVIDKEMWVGNPEILNSLSITGEALTDRGKLVYSYTEFPGVGFDIVMKVKQ